VVPPARPAPRRQHRRLLDHARQLPARHRARQRTRRALRDDTAAASRGFAVAQLGSGAFAWIAFCAADRLSDAANALGASVNALAPGALLAIAMLLPLTLCVGATFPFAVRLLARDARDASPASARVYAWNTLGSIVGAVGTGYFLLPWRGFVGTLVAAALANLTLAFASSLFARPARRALAATALAAALFLALFPTPRPDRLLRASPLGGDYQGTFTYLGVGRSSTAAMIDQGMGWRLTNNGLPESYVRPAGYPPNPTAAEWLSLLPVLVRPDTAHMLIIGLGAGMTLAAVPSTVETIDVIELEPEVVTANRSVPDRAGGDPLADPRAAVRLGDARGALVLANRRFDAIVSQPSHPWTAGASHLYTREFFALVHSRLSPGGVFVQWIGAAFVDPPRLRALLAAQNEVFANVQAYLPEGGAIVIVSSDQPIDIVASAASAIARKPDDFATTGIHRVEDVVAALALDAGGTRALAAGARANSDDRNEFATSDRPSVANSRKNWLDAVLAPHDPLPELVGRVDVQSVLLSLRGNSGGERARRIAAALGPARRELALGWIEVDAQRPRRAAQHFREALAADPTLESAAIGLALVDAKAPIDGLPDRARAVIETVHDENWTRARANDALLAQWQPGEVLFLEAAEQRLRWRIELGEPAELEPAIAIVDTVLTRNSLPRFLVYRAEIAARLGRPDLAWLSLHAVAADTNMRPAPQVAQRALDLVQKLGEPPLPAIRAGLDQFAHPGRMGMMREGPGRAAP
jgi:spermidine synthase